MPSSVNFDNGSERFNIYLGPQGRLNFYADGADGNGDLRVSISDLDAQITIGGSGSAGRIQFTDGAGNNTMFIGPVVQDTGLIVGGGVTDGRVLLQNSQGLTTIDMEGSTGNLYLGAPPPDTGQDGGLILRNANGENNVSIFGSGTIYLGGDNISISGIERRVRLQDSNNLTTIEINGSSGYIFLGADPSGSAPGQDGDLFIRDGNGGVSITLSGSNGTCRCVSLTETSDLRLKEGISPLLNALDRVLAMRGVSYQRKQEDSSKKTFSDESQIGFIGQEMETVCPEIVSTDSEGYKALNYSRLTPILVEAIKEQQQLLQQQASALGEALEKIARIEAAMKEQSA